LPFLRGKSVFPCARGRYSLAPGVGILCPRGRYSLRKGSVLWGVCTTEVRRFAASSHENMRERSVLWGSELLDHGQICARGRYCGAWWVRVSGSYVCRRSARQHQHLARSPTVETVTNLRQRSVSRPFLASGVGIPCARGRYSLPFLRGRSVFHARVLATATHNLPAEKAEHQTHTQPHVNRRSRLEKAVLQGFHL
jgi:hypothetical protein